MLPTVGVTTATTAVTDLRACTQALVQRVNRLKTMRLRQLADARSRQYGTRTPSGEEGGSGALGVQLRQHALAVEVDDSTGIGLWGVDERGDTGVEQLLHRRDVCGGVGSHQPRG